MPISMTARTWMVRNIPNRNTIEDFTEEIDEARFVRQYSSLHLLMRMLCLCLALMNLLLCVAPPSSSLVTRAVAIPQWDVKSDYLNQVRRQPRVDLDSRFPVFRLTSWPCARMDQNGTTRSCMGPLQLCGSSSWRKMKVKKENLSLFPNGLIYAVISVNVTAIMNRTSGHWTMIGSVKITIVKPWHSLVTIYIPTIDLDTSCAAVMICVSS